MSSNKVPNSKQYILKLNLIKRSNNITFTTTIIKLNLIKRSNNITFTTTIITILLAKQLCGAFYQNNNNMWSTSYKYQVCKDMTLPIIYMSCENS